MLELGSLSVSGSKSYATKVTVLADTAIRGKDLDEAEAEQARKRAEEALQNTGSNLEYATAQAELAYATAQLAAIVAIPEAGISHERKVRSRGARNSGS